jgi:hypothetical protein
MHTCPRTRQQQINKRTWFPLLLFLEEIEEVDESGKGRVPLGKESADGGEWNKCAGGDEAWVALEDVCFSVYNKRLIVVPEDEAECGAESTDIAGVGLGEACGCGADVSVARGDEAEGLDSLLLAWVQKRCECGIETGIRGKERRVVAGKHEEQFSDHQGPVTRHHSKVWLMSGDDDAFAVPDDEPTNPFSRHVIRQDIVTAWTNLPPEPNDADTNDSVSTLDIDAAAHESPVELGTAHSMLSAEFSQISLSPTIDDAVDTPYPNVVIDASEASDHRVTLTLDHHTAATPSDPSPVPSIRSLPPESMPRSPTAESASASIPPLTIATNTHHSTPAIENHASQPAQKHRPTRSTGPSMFEKVRSKTRPVYLPPKPKAEDEKHLADWEKMMHLSRAAGLLPHFPHALYPHSPFIKLKRGVKPPTNDV